MKKLIVIEGLDGSGKATQAGLLCKRLQTDQVLLACDEDIPSGPGDDYPMDDASLDGMPDRGGGEDRVKEKENLKARQKICIRQISFPDYESQSSALVKMYLAGEFGEKPSNVNAYAASSFYAVDRYASFKKDWEKDWESGIVIADRYTTSNAIHQCSKLDESEWDGYLGWLFDYEYRKLKIPEPDIVIYLRVDPEVSQRLLAVRYEGDLTREDIHEKDVEYLKSCQAAADFCSKKLGWEVVECCEDGYMRSADDIHKEIIQIITGLDSFDPNDSDDPVETT